MREVDQGRRAVRANPQSHSNILAFVGVNPALLRKLADAVPAAGR